MTMLSFVPSKRWLLVVASVLLVVLAVSSADDKDGPQSLFDKVWSQVKNKFDNGGSKDRGGVKVKSTSTSGCSFVAPTETTEVCKEEAEKFKKDQDLPLCVGVRGNGQQLWVHFPALARIVEAFGPVYGYAGGSSATITGFLLESMQSNPLISDCGDNTCCNDVQQKARLSLLLKSVQAISDKPNAIAFASIIAPVVTVITQKQILERLKSQDKDVRDAAVAELIDILETKGKGGPVQGVFQLVNPEFIHLLKTSPDPVYHAKEILESSKRGLDPSDPMIFIRPYPLNFVGVAELLAVLAGFYAADEPVDKNLMSTFMNDCAVPGLGLDWLTIEKLSTSTSSTCGEMFDALYQDYLDHLDAKEYPSRVNNQIGATMKTLITTSVLEGDAVKTWKAKTDEYYQGNPVKSMDVSFDDVKFGYFGDKKTLKKVEKALPKSFSDAKSQRFVPLGPATWLDVIKTSPAEPSLARGVVISDGTRVSVGGWTDQIPTQVLTAMGCQRIVLINRPGGVGTFPLGITSLLGITDETKEDLYSQTGKDSAWTTALAGSHASICADWETAEDVAGLAATGYNAPLLTDDPCILSLDIGGDGETKIGGCSPLVEAEA